MHAPVMLDEVLAYLAVRPDGLYADTTTGGGGHAAAIAARLAGGRLLAFDRDSEALSLAAERLKPWAERVTLRRVRFSQLEESLRQLGVERLDGLVADLGVSMMHLKDAARGFSFQLDGPLDMRMSREETVPAAADLVNFSSEQELARIFSELGEERRYAKKVARAILRQRPVRTTLELAQIIESALPYRRGRLHPATRFFQALRMAVNDEMAELESLLQAIPRVLRPGGRAVIITFQSLEDRKVKHAFQDLARRGLAAVLTRKVVRPAKEEVSRNPASRSAKLRALEVF
jgi:16S rRNA (cytosine1402-N4)-methyltransferase